MLELVPVSLKEANAFVARYHRHHKPVVGHKFSVAAAVNGEITDGTHNACSFLYAAAWRAARNMGYKRLVTYILDTETGGSLRAAGWRCIGEAGCPAGDDAIQQRGILSGV